MTDQTDQHNTRCEHETHHSEHLCYLMYEGFHLSNKPAYKDIVQNAQYRCQNCGRTAHDADNLCAPIDL